MVKYDGVEQGSNREHKLVERLVATGNRAFGHLFLNPMAEPEDGAQGRVYLGTDGALHVHDGTAWRQVADAGSLATSGSDARTAVQQAANHITRGNRCVFFGDSITKSDDGEYTITNNQGGGRSYHTYATFFTGGGILPIHPSSANVPQHNQGVSGETTTDMLDRVDDVIALAPDYVFICGGANDAGVSAAPVATVAANISSMADQFLAAGIIPILITPPPNDTGATADLVRQYNAWLYGYGAANNLRVVDLWPTTADTDGSWLTGYAADGVHPDFLGAKAMGQAVATALADLFPHTPYLTTTADDPINMVLNGIFVGDANADGTADSWSKGGTGTVSLVAGDVGNKQSIANTAGCALNQVVSTGFSAGDLISVSGIVTTTDMPASPTQGASVRVWFRDSGGGILGKMDPIWNLGNDVASATFYREGVVPAGTANIRIFLGFGGNDAATALYERVTMLNLTTLGLD